MSEKLKHTPGPWAWQKFGTYRLLTAQHGMREIIIASKKEPDDSFVTYPAMNKDGILQPIDEKHPNAKLIAAAPELLEALEECAELLNLFASKAGCQTEDASLKSDAEDYGALNALRKAKATIKKATE